MQDLYEGIELTAEQTEWICRGLLDLAAVDGVDPSEIELVKEFYQSGTGKPADIEALKGDGFDLAAAAETFKTGGDTLIEAFIVSCYMLIYADGEHSDQERSRISEFAAAAGLSSGALEELHVKARLYLLETLAQSLRNREIVKQVGISNLGLTAEQVATLSED